MRMKEHADNRDEHDGLGPHNLCWSHMCWGHMDCVGATSIVLEPHRYVLGPHRLFWGLWGLCMGTLHVDHVESGDFVGPQDFDIEFYEKLKPGDPEWGSKVMCTHHQTWQRSH